MDFLILSAPNCLHGWMVFENRAGGCSLAGPECCWDLPWMPASRWRCCWRERPDWLFSCCGCSGCGCWLRCWQRSCSSVWSELSCMNRRRHRVWVSGRRLLPPAALPTTRRPRRAGCVLSFTLPEWSSTARGPMDVHGQVRSDGWYTPARRLLGAAAERPVLPLRRTGLSSGVCRRNLSQSTVSTTPHTWHPMASAPRCSP